VFQKEKEKEKKGRRASIWWWISSFYLLFLGFPLFSPFFGGFLDCVAVFLFFFFSFDELVMITTSTCLLSEPSQLKNVDVYILRGKQVKKS